MTLSHGVGGGQNGLCKGQNHAMLVNKGQFDYMLGQFSNECQ